MKNRLSALASPAAALLAFLSGGALLTGCLQDPGQTGMGYLNQQGVKLSAPLYHFSFENLPVDSAFNTAVSLDHYGDSQVVVGRQARFSASVRLGFGITTALQHRQLDTGLSLRIVPMRLRGLTGKDFLTAAARNRDSLTLLVESFAWVDTGGNYQDSLTAFDLRYIKARTPFAAAPARYRRLDTVKISPKGSYSDTASQDTSQVMALPHLRQLLRAVGDSTHKWAVFLEIAPLAGTTDTGMFRFSSQTSGRTSYVRTYGSGLWLGRYSKDSVTTVGTLLSPYLLGSTGKPGSNYEVKYSGSNSTLSLLFGVTQGVHFRLNRDTLLSRIRAGLNATPGDSTLGDRLLGLSPAGKFDRRFYVPYAELRFPLRDSLNRVDGPFAYDVSVVSDVDSVATGEVLGNVSVGLNTAANLTVLGGINDVNSNRDSLRVTYSVHPDDSTLRRITTAWGQNPETIDTLTMVPDGVHREVVARSHSGWIRQANLNVIPTPSQLLIGVHFSAQSFTEPNFIRDSTGKTNVKTNAGLKRRFYRPGADSLTVRATMGLGQLLNRTSASTVTPDIYVRGVDRATYDTTTYDGASYRRVPFPTFGEVVFPRQGGKVKVGLDIYLYPLEGGQ
jgi:hypothetical protein